MKNDEAWLKVLFVREGWGRLFLVMGAMLFLRIGFAGLFGAAPAPCQEERIMTFNIRYGTAADGENEWPKRRDQVFEVIARHAPDVIGLQEALRFQIDEILAALPSYRSLGVGRDDGQAGGEHTALVYRADNLIPERHGNFWFSNTPDVPGSKNWGNQTTRMCTWAKFTDRRTGARFYVYNVHLDHRSQPSRERSVAMLLEKIRSRDEPLTPIVVGDFNAGESNPAVRLMRGEVGASGRAESVLSFQDSFRKLHPEAAAVGTFNAFQGTASGEKIDYIFVPASIGVKYSEIVRDARQGRYPSDHFPVTAVLCLP